jgi:hypothetical protein
MWTTLKVILFAFLCFLWNRYQDDIVAWINERLAAEGKAGVGGDQKST